MNPRAGRSGNLVFALFAFVVYFNLLNLGQSWISVGAANFAGFVLARLGRLPQAGDHVVWQGYRFEVVDMDGRRVDKVLVARVASPEP